MAGVDVLASAFSGANAAFLGEQYARWATNPQLGRSDLRRAVRRAERRRARGAGGGDRRVLGAASSGIRSQRCAPPPTARTRARRRSLSGEQVRAATIASLRALMLIRSYRVRGHLEARLDPLGLQIPRRMPSSIRGPMASPTTTSTSRSSSTTCSAARPRRCAKSRRILRDTYCGPIGVEFMHIQDPDQKSWIQRRVEGAPWRTAFDASGQARHPDAAHRGRRLRGVLPEALRHHQALRPGGRRGHHPGAARHHRDGGLGRASRRSPSACRIAAG